MSERKKFSYNDTDINREAAERTLADGAIVKLCIEKVSYKYQPTKGKGPGEDTVQLCRCAVLNPEDGTSKLKQQTIWIRNVLPLRDPDNLETHVPPEYSKGLWAQFLQGFASDFYPGDAETAKEKAEKRLELAAQFHDTDGSDLLMQVAYATIKLSPSDSGQMFVNANDLRAELRPHESLTPLDNLFVDVIAGEVQEAPQEKTTKAKPAARRKRR